MDAQTKIQAARKALEAARIQLEAAEAGEPLTEAERMAEAALEAHWGSDCDIRGLGAVEGLTRSVLSDSEGDLETARRDLRNMAAELVVVADALEDLDGDEA